MKKIIGILSFLSIFLISSTSVFSQQSQLKVEIETNSNSKKINDGIAIAKVEGGKSPYKFKWTNKSTAQDSARATGLTEGITYNLMVYDSQNDSVLVELKVPASSMNEFFNAGLTPAVEFLGMFVMADIFALTGVYDPIKRNDSGEIIRYPNGDPQKMKIPIIVVWLVIGALFFTFRMGFINIRGIKHSIDLVRGKYDKPGHKGEVSHFQALATALSATVGLGNIAGVAIAISIGGPGATFWMIVAGFLGMSTKFVECTLGVKYRRINEKGEVSGGPMYYMSEGLKKIKLGKLGKVLAVLFSVLVIGGSLGGGNMFQANQAFAQLASIAPQVSEYGVIFGVLLAVLVGIVIIGGVKRIAKVTDKIVPFMAILYVAVALIIIIMHIDRTGEAFKLILNGAFSATALKGGIIGVMIVGFQRAAFSNEAGVGSASIAHSAVKTDEPVSEGLVALLEPFIDTVVICTMTALVIIYSGMYTNPEGLGGVELTSAAFAEVFSWFPYLLVVAIMLFAFSSMISWSYYGLNGFKYLFGGMIKNEKVLKNIYYGIFLFFVVVGSAASLGAVVDFSDFMILSMAFPNILALYLLSKEVRLDLKSFLKRIKTGEIKKYK